MIDAVIRSGKHPTRSTGYRASVNVRAPGAPGVYRIEARDDSGKTTWIDLRASDLEALRLMLASVTGATGAA